MKKPQPLGFFEPYAERAAWCCTHRCSSQTTDWSLPGGMRARMTSHGAQHGSARGDVARMSTAGTGVCACRHTAGPTMHILRKCSCCGGRMDEAYFFEDWGSRRNSPDAQVQSVAA